MKGVLKEEVTGLIEVDLHHAHSHSTSTVDGGHGGRRDTITIHYFNSSLTLVIASFTSVVDDDVLLLLSFHSLHRD